eukprot:gene8697-biopygen22654
MLAWGDSLPELTVTFGVSRPGHPAADTSLVRPGMIEIEEPGPYRGTLWGRPRVRRTSPGMPRVRPQPFLRWRRGARFERVSNERRVHSRSRSRSC